MGDAVDDLSCPISGIFLAHVYRYGEILGEKQTLGGPAGLLLV